MNLHTFLLVAALICFVLAAMNVGGKINLTAAGLACWVATLLF